VGELIELGWLRALDDSDLSASGLDLDVLDSARLGLVEVTAGGRRRLADMLGLDTPTASATTVLLVEMARPLPIATFSQVRLRACMAISWEAGQQWESRLGTSEPEGEVGRTTAILRSLRGLLIRTARRWRWDSRLRKKLFRLSSVRRLQQVLAPQRGHHPLDLAAP
jgi:hypothetical protein